MEALPGDVVAALARGVGVYVRATAAAELPPALRTLRGFTDRGMARNRTKLVGALDDEVLRKRILEWLDGRPSIARPDAEILRLACERPEDWVEKLAARSAGPPPPRVRPAHGSSDQLEREKERARRAREEARRAKEEARRASEKERASAADHRKELGALKSELAQARARARASAAEEARARAALERERRKARRDVDGAAADALALRTELKSARREIARLRSKQTPEPRPPTPTTARGGSERRRARGPRRPLRAPKGRLEDDPGTLDEWLDTDGVRLLVDGYNVAKAEGGFGELDLTQQRERVIQGVARLARKKKIPVVVVFDGSDVPPATSRRSRGPVAVEYSRPEETADDHLVATLAALPPDPVVVVTNDRELQDRIRGLGGTVATSNQLLTLIR